MITPCFKKFRSSGLDLCFLLHVSICGVSGHARVKCQGRLFTASPPKRKL